MGIDISNYRARIGMFNCRVKNKSKNIKKNIDTPKMFILLQILLITICWSYCCSVNKLEHSLHGNRKIGYKIASWNCNRGLISNSERESDKMVDIKMFIEKHKPHLMAIIESDIHGPKSRIKINKYYTASEICDKLNVDG